MSQAIELATFKIAVAMNVQRPPSVILHCLIALNIHSDINFGIECLHSDWKSPLFCRVIS